MADEKATPTRTRRTKPTHEPEKTSDEFLDPRAFFTRLARAHPAYTFALATFTLTALKVMGVALFDPNTAYGLLASADAGQLLLSVFISVFPVGATLLVVFGAAIFGAAMATRRLRYGSFMVLLIGLSVSTGTAPLILLALGAAVGVFAGATGYFTLRGGLDAPPSPGDERIRAFFADEKAQHVRDMLTTSFVAVVLSFIVVVMYVMYGSEPWVPAERITVTGKPEVVGYVIQQGDGWTTILGATDRLIELVPTDTITSRDVCTPTRDPWGRTLVSYLAGVPMSPTCPFP